MYWGRGGGNSIVTTQWEVGGGLRISANQHYECVQPNVVSVTRQWVCPFLNYRKSVTQHLNGSSPSI